MSRTETETNTPPAARGRLRGPLIALASLVVFLGVLEVAARQHLGDSFRPGEQRGSRWTIVARFDPDLGWSNRPGARGHVLVRKPKFAFDYRVAINSLGLRDPERDTARTPAATRVCVLGDSMAWGWGVDDGQRFTDVLDGRLGSDVEVWNFAVPGYGTDQQYWTLTERVATYQPDVVVLCFVLNDVFEVGESERYGMRKPSFQRDESGTWVAADRPVPDPRGFWARSIEPRLGALARDSALLDWILRCRDDPETEAAPSLLEGRAERGTRPLRPQAIEQMRRTLAKLEAPDSKSRMLLERIASWCDEREIPLLVVPLPHLHDQYLYEPLVERPTRAAGDEGEPFHTEFTLALESLGSDVGFPVVSVDDALWEASGRGRTLHCGDGHFNAEGNELVADVLEPRLRAAVVQRRIRRD